MTEKLWITWGVLSVTALAMAALGNKAAMYGFAIAAAVAGWSAFLTRQ